MDINLLAMDLYKTAKERGCTGVRFPQVVSVCQAKLEDAIEAYERDEPLFYINAERNNKPVGVSVDMAEALVRILEWFGEMQLDPTDIIMAKRIYEQRLKGGYHVDC